MGVCEEGRALSTSTARCAESMLVPTTATLPEVKVSFAKDFTDSRETGVWGFVRGREPCR